MSSFVSVGWLDVERDRINRITVLPYQEDTEQWVLPRTSRGPELPSTVAAAGEDLWSDGVSRLVRAEIGRGVGSCYPFAVAGAHAAVWCNTLPADDASSEDVWRGDAHQAAKLLRAGRSRAAAELMLLADRARNELRDELFYEANSWVIEPRYLEGDTPQAQSGFRGSTEEWRAAREMLVDALPAEYCTFLDIGCANGYLAECLTEWAAERGITLQAYGLDISEALVDRARVRLPGWQDRFWSGNAASWTAPGNQRFDVVHTMVDYVPEHARRALLDHLLTNVVADGGRLLLSAYRDDGNDREDAAAILRSLGFEPAGVTGPGVTPAGDQVRSAWVERPA